MTSRNTPGNHPGKKPSKSQMQKQQAAKRAMAAASGAKAARRKRLLQVLVPVVTVIVVVGILIGVKVSTDNNAKPNTASAASQAVTNAVTHVPPSVFDKVGSGSALGPTKKLTGAALTKDGKPHILYVGAEWCPYCAAERWALAAALSRFGTLTDLGVTRSSATDQAGPDEPTLSFHGSKYTSEYISATTAEIRDNANKPLDKLTGQDQKLWNKLGTGYPFLDIGGKYEFGVQYDPTLLGGKSSTQADIADAMQDPNSTIGKAIIGSANILTAAICDVTDNQPSNVCTSKGVVAAKPKLSGAKS